MAVGAWVLEAVVYGSLELLANWSGDRLGAGVRRGRERRADVRKARLLALLAEARDGWLALDDLSKGVRLPDRRTRVLLGGLECRERLIDGRSYWASPERPTGSDHKR